jgi:hypothetical protein
MHSNKWRMRQVGAVGVRAQRMQRYFKGLKLPHLLQQSFSSLRRTREHAATMLGEEAIRAPVEQQSGV